MLETIDSYIYTGLSFSTFKFDKVSFLCLKYQLSKLRKRHYIKLIKNKLINNPYYNTNEASIKYLIKSNLNSLENSTLLIDPNDKEYKLVIKFLKREKNISKPICKNDLSEEIKTKKACFFFLDEKEKEKHLDVINSFENREIIYIENILNKIKKDSESESIIDEIRIKILQDMDSEIFFTNIEIFSNIINDFIFTLNKIAINL